MSLLRTASFFAKPHSGGRRLQLQLQAAGFQTSAEDADHGREGGGAVVNSEGGLEDPTNNNELGPDADADVSEAALLRKMRTGRGRAGAEALELFQSDATWNRAQYLLLLGAEGPSLLGRDEAVMASKEWAGELRMRPPPGSGKKARPGRRRKGDQKGGKDKKGKGGKGKEAEQRRLRRLRHLPRALQARPSPSRACVLDGDVLDFELGDRGDSDDEGLPTGKDLKHF